MTVGKKDSFSSLRQIDHHGDDAVRIYENTEADDYPAHWHRSYELIMPVRNSYTVVVGSGTCVLMPGEVLIIPSGMVHEILAPEDGMRYLFLVDHRVLYNMEGFSPVEQAFYPYVHMKNDGEEGIRSQVLDLLWQAVREDEEGRLMSASMVVNCIRRIFILLSRTLQDLRESGGPGIGRRDSDALAAAIDYINLHCTEKLTLEGVADYAGYSKYHFARIFKDYTGVSFYTYYMRQRVQVCRDLLGDKSLSVTEVALRTGFGSIATFNRVFRQVENVSPTEYRKMRQSHRQETQEMINRNI